MAIQELETATYVLKVVSPPQGDDAKSPVYHLEDKEYHSPEELVRSIVQIHDQQAILESHQEIDLKNHIVALQSVVLGAKEQLDKIRFLMTDRITSALMKITLLNAKNQNSFSESEQSWVNEGLNDLTQLGFAIDEWNRLCEIMDINHLEDTTKLNKIARTLLSID